MAGPNVPEGERYVQRRSCFGRTMASLQGSEKALRSRSDGHPARKKEGGIKRRDS